MDLQKRRLLISKIIIDGYAMSTAFAFCNGNRTPVEHYKETIAGYVEEITGKKIPVSKLFPAS